MKTIFEDDRWQVVTRINRSGNLTIEVGLDGMPHAEVVLQTGGTIDLGTRARPWPLGEQGWDMPGAPSQELRKFRFGPGAVDLAEQG